jgi:hypothetical protein
MTAGLGGGPSAGRWCQRCGSVMSADAAFCPRCGSPQQVLPSPPTYPPPLAYHLPPQPQLVAARARNNWARPLLIIVLLVALGAGGLYLVSPDFRGHLQQAVTPSCTVGLNGAAVSVTVEGPDAQTQCGSFLNQTTNGGTWYVYSGGQQPAGASICQVTYKGDLFTVRDQGSLNVYGSAICTNLTRLANGEPIISATPQPRVDQKGQVVFSTDRPMAGVTTGCTVANQVTVVAANTSVYATYIFSSGQGSEVVSLSVTKDGISYLPATAMPAADTSGLDCFADTTDLGTLPNWGPGTYHFSLTTGSDGSVISEGDLTVE